MIYHIHCLYSPLNHPSARKEYRFSFSRKSDYRETLDVIRRLPSIQIIRHSTEIATDTFRSALSTLIERHSDVKREYLKYKSLRLLKRRKNVR